ncbi:hypothetical protein [Alkalihalobacillus pseudalcaliphilus]|uniref:hypothetical protein n=1 Tax=Alkalihalobacillus pseudalcaliphilus TaxID=79884 RepID=UPI00064DAF62|nr:hypothetical protein [Alkalihalobacillus pseudalcaliphilus]KMK74592.1 hypothetical protein AB990_18990 [Alkalihalobacillus pseudalcaliphilus]
MKIFTYLFKLPRIVHILFIMLIFWFISNALYAMGESGQMLSFIFYNLILFHFFFFLFLLMSVSLLLINIYYLITKKANKPVKMMLTSIPLLLLFSLFTIGFWGDGVDEIKDVFHYVKGNMTEEQATVTDIQQSSSKLRGKFDEYTLTDGTILSAYKRGVYQEQVQIGEVFIFRYLPETKTILSMKKVE